jgi:TorA maturation chaperone TorD
MQRAVIDGKPTDDIIWEYRRLFVGPNKMPAPPWGSVYTDREQVIFGAATLDLRQWMREQGIERLGDEKTPEDQIGLMLVLMAWIAQNKPQVLEDYLQHHLLTWSSHFLDELIEAVQQSFYEGLARLTKATLEGLQSDLHLSVEYPRYYR